MKKIGLIATLAFFPLVSFAALGNISSLVTDIGAIVKLIIPILFAVALLGFFYGLVLYIFSGEHDAEKAKKYMLWGVVALFVMASVWGLVAFLGNAIGLPTSSTPVAPAPNVSGTFIPGN